MPRRIAVALLAPSAPGRFAAARIPHRTLAAAFAGAFGGRADGSAGGLPPRLIWRNPFTPV